MLKKVARVLGGDPQKKTLDQYKGSIEQINQCETSKYEKISDDELRQSTQNFRTRLNQGETLDDILPEAFTAVREASKRTIGLRHYDVQLMGGIVLHEGKVAEMRTGEGKTLVATMPLYLNALTGGGVHLITVNDYLARRDARWMGPIYDLLGMRVGVLQMSSRTDNARNGFLVDLETRSSREDQDQLKVVPRQEAYLADITYGTNSEFGFDYLRDNLTTSLSDRVQRGHHYAIVDEVDNILIDEARTPLIISGPAADESQWYQRMAQVVKLLKEEDYDFNEKDRSVALTEGGEARVEEMLGVTLRNPDRPEDINPEQARLLGYLEQVLKAKLLFKKNKDYIIQSGQVVIVDEFTGRLMPGRRWSEGLHQAVEAMEGVHVRPENITYASITLQNYFRKYEKLAGMTGTAQTEAEELFSIYKLEVISIPTNLDYLAASDGSDLITAEEKDEQGYAYTYYADRNDPDRKELFWKRKDYPDVIYRTSEAKLRAITQEIIKYHVLGRPLLVGTASVEHSEFLSSRLQALPLRRLLQTLLLQQRWLEKNNQQGFDKVIPELQFLNAPLEKLGSNEMHQLGKSLDLSSINVDDEENLQILQRFFEFKDEDMPRFKGILQRGIQHSVLNARNHDEESKIISNAGDYGSVMIATNMAGRGIDIKLGGSLHEEVIPDVMRVLKKSIKDPYDLSVEEIYDALKKIPTLQYGIYDEQVNQFKQYHEKMKLVRQLGGLHVIGSEKHEARRIDNQLRGRAARQGDPGSSRFFVSWEDDLMRLFGEERKDWALKLLNYNDLLPMELNLYGRVINQAQERVEGYNFDIRKHLLEYDDVLNSQRERIYAERDKALTKPSVMEDVLEMLQTELEQRIPMALQDADGPWKLLSYLEEIQPTMYFESENALVPSFMMSTLLDMIKSKLNGKRKINSEAITKFLVSLAQQALEIEKAHLLAGANNFLDRSIESFEQQLTAKQDEVDTYFEGMQMQIGESGFNPRTALNELQTAFNIRLALTQEQNKDIPSYLEVIRQMAKDLVAANAKKLLITRITKTYGRRMDDSLDLPADELAALNWDDIRNRILSLLANFMDARIAVLCGSEGQVAKNIVLLLKGQAEIEWDDNLVLELLARMGEVSRMMLDVKSHQKVMRKSNLINYLFLVAHMIENQDAETLTKRTLDHLLNVQKQLLMIFGQLELHRILQPQISLNQLDGSTRAKITSTIGEEKFNQFKNQPTSIADQPGALELCTQLGQELQNSIFRYILLNSISSLWIEHLTQMEGLRVSIGMEAYAQRDPLVQYKSQASDAFKNLLDNIRMNVIHQMFRARPSTTKPSQTNKTPQGKIGEKRSDQPQFHGKKKHKKRHHH